MAKNQISEMERYAQKEYTERGYTYDEDEFYDGISVHLRAIDVADYEFFWDPVNEMAPFGSDEGYTALAEFVDWRKKNRRAPMMKCLDWIFESWKMKARDYSSAILDTERIEEELDKGDSHFLFEIIYLDITIIGTGFGQLITEGMIDEEIKPFVRLALDRQAHPLVAEFHALDPPPRIEYMEKLKELLERA